MVGLGFDLVKSNSGERGGAGFRNRAAGIQSETLRVARVATHYGQRDDRRVIAAKIYRENTYCNLLFFYLTLHQTRF